MSYGAVIVGAAALISGYMASRQQANSASEAGAMAWDIAQMQDQTVRRLYQQARDDTAAYRFHGVNAAQELAALDLEKEPQKYLDKLMEVSFPSGVDPTGGAQKYIDELGKLEFKLDANDPIYQWRQAENTRTVNQFMASRGGYDSRAAANMLLQSGMQLQGEETERQFNQRYLTKYNQLADQAKLAMQQGATKYGAAKDKYTSDVAKQTTGFNAALMIGQNRYNQLADQVKGGLAASGQTAQMGMQAANQLTNIWGQASEAGQNAILQGGAANAQFINSVGSMPSNVLATNAMLEYLNKPTS